MNKSFALAKGSFKLGGGWKTGDSGKEKVTPVVRWVLERRIPETTLWIAVFK